MSIWKRLFGGVESDTELRVTLPIPKEFKNISEALYKTLILNIGGMVRDDVESAFAPHLKSFSGIMTEDRSIFVMKWHFDGARSYSPERVQACALDLWNDHCQTAIAIGRDNGELEK